MSSSSKLVLFGTCFIALELMDPGASNADATVDCEMLLSDDWEDGLADRKRLIIPTPCIFSTGLLEDGQMATAAQTCGDGACSLHSLWGSVFSTPVVSTYYCEDARHKLCEAMPIYVSDILKSACGAAARLMLDNIFCDAIAFMKRRTLEEPSLPSDSVGVAVFLEAFAIGREKDDY